MSGHRWSAERGGGDLVYHANFESGSPTLFHCAIDDAGAVGRKRDIVRALRGARRNRDRPS